MHASKLAERYSVFNRTDVVAVGWYWLMLSSELRRGAVRPVNIVGYELAVFRGEDGRVAALDAYCPHMGAHLSEGKVEGNELRCFFHNWCFDRSGACVDIPCMATKPPAAVSTRSWTLAEKHGVIWIWLGEGEPTMAVPEPPGLAGADYIASIGNKFVKNCHPNVVMINAIDEQHFRTVHSMPGHILSMEPNVRDDQIIEFRNIGCVPKSHWLGRFIAPFYKTFLTYETTYWNGSTGTVTFGPDFLHLYLMFAMRMSADGKADGLAIAFTKARSGLFGWLANIIILALTKIGGKYFAVGDTRIFQTIRFQLKTPIPADRAVLAFIQHLERQNVIPAQAPRLR
jgi:phenylpropionate dioxygenase-like ring-hydroxylating dioxygenase large terminal subunit